MTDTHETCFVREGGDGGAKVDVVESRNSVSNSGLNRFGG